MIKDDHGWLQTLSLSLPLIAINRCVYIASTPPPVLWSALPIRTRIIPATATGRAWKPLASTFHSHSHFELRTPIPDQP